MTVAALRGRKERSEIMTDRRSFLAALGGAAGSAAFSGCSMFTGAASDYDDNLAVILSDIHVCGDESLGRWLYTRRELRLRIAEILAMKPLPRYVITFGDLAFKSGDPADYAIAAAEFKALTGAGVKVVHGTGNHDRRKAMSDYFPEASVSPVKGRRISEVHFPSCDLILLDTLIEGEVDGEIGAEQFEWLNATLAGRTRPVFVGAHHSPFTLKEGTTKLVRALKNSPTCAGWINGHGHTWEKRPMVSWGRDEDVIRSLQLPSAGFWGDIGYVEFRAGADCAEASLIEKGFWFNDEPHPGEAIPETWWAIVAENRGQRCRFPYSRAHRTYRAAN